MTTNLVAAQRCIKCGATDHWTRWLAKETPGYGFSTAYRAESKCRQRNIAEHLCRGCRNCGFTWDEPIRDWSTKDWSSEDMG